MRYVAVFKSSNPISRPQGLHRDMVEIDTSTAQKAKEKALSLATKGKGVLVAIYDPTGASVYMRKPNRGFYGRR